MNNRDFAMSLSALNTVLNDSFLGEEKKLSEESSLLNILGSFVILHGPCDCKETDGGKAYYGRPAPGFLLTDDGFFLSSYSRLFDFELDLKKSDFHKTSHIDWYESRSKHYFMKRKDLACTLDTSICLVNPSLDLALLKANTYQEPIPRMFNVAKHELVKGEKVYLLRTSVKSKFTDAYFSEGNVLCSSRDIKNADTGLNTYDTFLTGIEPEPDLMEYSFLKSNADFAGLYLYSSIDASNKKSFGMGGAKTMNIADFLSSCVRILSEKGLKYRSN